MRVGIVIIAGALALAGCFSTPKMHSFDSSRVYDATKDAIWEKLIAWLTSNQVQIKTIEKDSGVVYAEPSSALDVSSVADCGSGDLGKQLQHVIGLNVFVHPLEAGKTQVSVNARIVEIRPVWGGATQSINCNSTGTLEARILAALAS